MPADAHEPARRRTTTGTFAAYKTQPGKFADVAGEYIGFKTPANAERESGVSWRVVESEYRATRLSLPNVSLFALAASTRAKLSGLGPRFELMAAGCIAALAGYGVTAWTCDLSAAKARAAHSSELALTGAAVAPALEVARAATWALANPDVAAATSLVSASATEPPHAVLAARSPQAQRARRNAPVSATGAKPTVAAHASNRATSSAVRGSQVARGAAGRHDDVAPVQADLIAMAVADKHETPRVAADEVAPMRPEDWRELALLVAPAESAQAAAPAHAEVAVPTAHAAEAERSADADAVPHAAVVGPALDSQPVQPAAAPRVPLGTFQSAPVATRAVLQNIEVRGPLPKSIIRRSLGRLESDFSQCAPICARNAEACGTGHWHAETVLDEAGRSRDPHVSGPESSSQMSECITKASSRLTILAPDTGTVRVSWDVKFTP